MCITTNMCIYAHFLPQTNKYKLHFKENNYWVCRVYFLCEIIKMVFLLNTVHFVAPNKNFWDLRIHEAYRSHFISKKITIKIPFDVLLHFFYSFKSEFVWISRFLWGFFGLARCIIQTDKTLYSHRKNPTRSKHTHAVSQWVRKTAFKVNI